MGFFDDFVGAIEGTAIGMQAGAGILGTAAGASMGASGINSTISSILNPKTPGITAPPSTPNLTNSGDAMQEAEEEEAKRARGEAANFLTSGGGAGLSNTGRTSRAVLLGS